MIGFLRGQLLHHSDTQGIIDVRDVGYEVNAPSRTLQKWATTDGMIEAWISTQVREDAITLYGFADTDERKAFDVLLSVTGVGPKIALAALDAFSVGELAKAIDTDEVATLQRISGVGKRTAQRLALELKGKMPAAFTISGTDNPSENVQQRHRPGAGANTLEIALARLGYTNTEIKRVHGQLESRGVSAEAPLAERLRIAVQILYGNG